MTSRAASLPALLFFAAVGVPAAGQCTGEVSIVMQGNHNPFLAGQPDGATAKSDTAPFESPFLVPMSVAGGDVLRFLNVSGDVWVLGGGGGPGPDGWTGHNFTLGSDLGISGYVLPEACLLGVFLDDQTNSGATPPDLDFGTILAQNQTSYAPGLFQTFFIGDGRTGQFYGNQIQEWTVPQGATRLFLGSSDGWNWSDNSGTFSLTVTKDVSLSACTPTVSLATGGTQTLELEAGAAYAGLPYLLLGSLSGTTPGTQVDTVVLPLNIGPHFVYTLQFANSPPLSNSFGSLDANGKATASFVLPPGLSPNLTGTTFHHAYVVIELLPTLLHVVFASNAVPVTLFP